MGYIEGRNLIRLDRSCKPPWEGELGKCKRPESAGEKLYMKEFPVSGAAAMDSVRSGGFPLSEYIRDPETTKIGVQRRYMDMLQATGARGLIPKIAETKATIRDLFNKEELEKSNKKKASFPTESTLEKAYVNSRKSFYQDLYEKDMDWAAKNKGTIDKLGITPTEAAAVRDYARPGTYRLVNGMARGMPETYYPPYGALQPYKGMSQPELEDVGSRTSRLLSGSIKKMEKYEGVTYRGLNLPQEAIDSLIKGGKWKEDGFMSSTKDMSLTYPGNVVYRIYSNKGADISSVEPVPNKEVLFPKKSVLKLKNHRVVKRFGKEFYIMDFVV